MAGLAPRVLTSASLRSLQRRVAAARRRLGGARPVVRYFHQVDDPYSALSVRALPHLEAAWGVRVRAYLVAPPAAAAAPDVERLTAWSLRDARTLADGLNLAPTFETEPESGAVRNAQAALAGLRGAREFCDVAAKVEAAFLGEAPMPGPAGGSHTITAALAEGERERRRRGHYLGATFHFEGEWYWGLDRLPALESRLARIRPGAEAFVGRLEVDPDPPAARGGAVIEAFVSLRSPYTYIALARLFELCARSGAALRLRPVLPMVMRGLPVPLAKRLYILRDVKREAERLGLEFGHIADPVGRPVERGMAVLHRAIAEGRGEAFLLSFMKGVWAEGVDAGSDRGLFALARRSGLDAGCVRAALSDDGWREHAEANRADLMASGLWGVPAFRVIQPGGEPGPARWGQDRLWAIEADLAACAS